MSNNTTSNKTMNNTMNNTSDKNGSANNVDRILSERDLDAFLQKSSDIIKRAERLKLKLVEPYEDEIYGITNIVMNYLKKNQRKAYGGFALNLLLKNKSPAYAIYDDSDVPDIDFYSPHPMKDLCAICNELHDKGYKNVMGREGMHKETYTIYANTQKYCDISYVPSHIYNNMPFERIDGIHVISAQFMLIDYYRLMTDIVLTSWRIEKTMKRLYLLQKHYPMPYIQKKLYTTPASKNTEMVNAILLYTQKFAENDPKNIIVIGFYAYNHFLKQSKLKNDYIKQIDVPFFDFIACNYIEIVENYITELKKTFPTVADKITWKEYYPFFQFLENSVEIYYDGILVLRVFSNAKRCLAYNSVQSDFFSEGKIIPGKKKISIGAFSINMLYVLIMIIYSRINDDKENKNMYYTIASHLFEMKKYYFEENNLTMLDESLFKEFVETCTGKEMSPDIEKQNIILRNKKKGKSYVFTYYPENGHKSSIEYLFSNTSGNMVTNDKYMKIFKNKNAEDLDDFDDSSDSDNDKSEKSDNSEKVVKIEKIEKIEKNDSKHKKEKK